MTDLPVQAKTRLRRTADHVVAGMTISAPFNMAMVFLLSSVIASPLALAVTTTIAATIFSGLRTYVVLSMHERQS